MTMKVLNESEAVKIATEYAHSLGIESFIVDGCKLLQCEEDGQYWAVFLSFAEDHYRELGDILEEYDDLPHFLTVRVDPVTGEPSHIPHL